MPPQDPNNTNPPQPDTKASSAFGAPPVQNPYYPSQYPAPTPQSTDLFGILSLVFAFVFAPAGIIFGIIGLYKAKKGGYPKLMSTIGIVVSSVLTIVMIGFVALFAMLMATEIQQSARDGERQTDIDSLSMYVDEYFSVNKTYPTLAQMNDARWRSDNLPDLTDEDLTDPVGGSTTLVSEPAKDVYAYSVSPAGCGAPRKPCTQYVITAMLELEYEGGEYTLVSPGATSQDKYYYDTDEYGSTRQ